MMSSMYAETETFFPLSILVFFFLKFIYNIVISLIWLILFHFVWKPWLRIEINEDIVKSGLLHSGHQSHHHHNKRNKSNHRYPDRMSSSSNHKYGKIHSD